MSERFKVHYADERWVLVDTKDGREVGYDGGEPEDQLLVRDWSWVPVELNKLDDELVALRRVKAQLVEALEAQEDCVCHKKGSRFSAYPCVACRERRRAALKAAKATP